MDLAAFPLEATLHRGERVRAERRAQGVHALVLARPERRNAFDAAMIEELIAALTLLEALPPTELRLLALVGEGDFFCAGADLAYMRAQADAARTANLQDARRLGVMFRQLATFPAPVVALVQGAALGGGLGLTVCADLVLATADAVFATTEVRLGIVPAVISPYILRRLGLSQASPLMLTGARVKGAEALALGLVHRLVAGSEDVTTALLDLLAAGPLAARHTKALLLENAPPPDDVRLEATAQLIAGLRVSEEGQAGLRAFLAKSPAPWAPVQP